VSNSNKKSQKKDSVTEKEEIIEIDHVKKDEIIEIETVKDEIIDIPTDEIIDIPTEEMTDIDIGKEKESIIDIDIGKKMESIIDINTIRDQTSRMGKKMRGETRRLLKSTNDMGPQGKKVLVAALMIGLIGGFAVSSTTCGMRVSSLKRRLLELEEGAQHDELSLAPGDSMAAFGSFTISSVSWDPDGQRISIELYNNGPVMMYIVTINVKRMDTTEDWYVDRKQGSTESVAPMSTRTVTWTAVYADAPSGYLEPDTRYRIKVFASTGYSTEWIEIMPLG
jgi:hypothetical protein